MSITEKGIDKNARIYPEEHLEELDISSWKECKDVINWAETRAEYDLRGQAKDTQSMRDAITPLLLKLKGPYPNLTRVLLIHYEKPKFIESRDGKQKPSTTTEDLKKSENSEPTEESQEGGGSKTTFDCNRDGKTVILVPLCNMDRDSRIADREVKAGTMIYLTEANVQANGPADILFFY